MVVVAVVLVVISNKQSGMKPSVKTGSMRDSNGYAVLKDNDYVNEMALSRSQK